MPITGLRENKFYGVSSDNVKMQRVHGTTDILYSRE